MRARRRRSLLLTLVAALPLAAYAQREPFDAWLEKLEAEALAAGISQATLDAALAGVTPLEEVIERDRNQPEVKLDFWTYLGRVVSERRIEQGRAKLEEHRALVEAIAGRYGMPPELLVAVWGVESNYGERQGGFPVIAALVTLAYDDRRPTMFRRELLHALRIIDDGHIEPAKMKGSWAGAMGQLQFMPSTFIDHAKDGDGDGRKDIWGSPADALESAASFMSSQWRRGQRWGRQVTVPAGFDRALAGLETRKPLADWQRRGVRLVDGSDLPAADLSASIVLPTDGLEPAFLVYQNYRALLRWNRSHLFALAVAHLADRIAGRPPLVGAP
ncbi:MAG TPA: lytic murein transglycosylase [Gammaproteobacteria bacterium]